MLVAAPVSGGLSKVVIAQQYDVSHSLADDLSPVRSIRQQVGLSRQPQGLSGTSASNPLLPFGSYNRRWRDCKANQALQWLSSSGRFMS